jgi:hypothetical protein
MFTDVPVLGLIFATYIGEFCASLGAALSVGAWRGDVETEGALVGFLFCAAAIACGVLAWRSAARMKGKWVGGIVTAATSLLFVIVMHAKGGFG